MGEVCNTYVYMGRHGNRIDIDSRERQAVRDAMVRPAVRVAASGGASCLIPGMVY